MRFDQETMRQGIKRYNDRNSDNVRTGILLPKSDPTKEEQKMDNIVLYLSKFFVLGILVILLGKIIFKFWWYNN